MTRSKPTLKCPDKVTYHVTNLFSEGFTSSSWSRRVDLHLDLANIHLASSESMIPNCVLVNPEPQNLVISKDLSLAFACR